MIFRILFLLIFGLITERAGAQLYAGFTADFGNRISNSPTVPEGLIKRPIMPSASLTLLRDSHIKNQWLLQYGVSVGILGYSLKALPYDSLASNQFGIHEPFPSYGTVYLSSNLVIGRHFQIDRRYVAVFLGGGLTLYRNWTEEGKLGSSPDVILFEYEMGRTNNTPKGFTEIDIQTNVSDRIVVGFRYRHHFNSALQGNYYFTQAKSSGQLSLAQRALSIVFLVRITSK